jgi:hypothetical protein
MEVLWGVANDSHGTNIYKYLSLSKSCSIGKYTMVGCASDEKRTAVRIGGWQKWSGRGRGCAVLHVGVPTSIPIFKLQKRVIQSLCGAGTGTSCRQLFKDCKILTVISLYVFEVLCFLKGIINPQYKKIDTYMIIIQGQIWIYISNLVIQSSIKKCN